MKTNLYFEYVIEDDNLLCIDVYHRHQLTKKCGVIDFTKSSPVYFHPADNSVFTVSQTEEIFKKMKEIQDSKFVYVQ